MTVVDLFSGAGGLAEGFSKENFDVVAHVEKENWMCETLKTRDIYYFLKDQKQLQLYSSYLRSGLHYDKIDQGRAGIYSRFDGLQELINSSTICKAFGDPKTDPTSTDINTIIQDISKAILSSGKGNSVDVLIGGPPCQAYSLIARHHQHHQIDVVKVGLYKYYLQILDHFRPKVFVFENVPGFLSMNNGEFYNAVCEGLDQLGYRFLFRDRTDPRLRITNACAFGVPQNRNRVILTGVRRDVKTYRMPALEKFCVGPQVDLTTATAISDLPSIHAGDNEDNILYDYPVPPQNAYQELMRLNSIGVINHKARPHRDQDKEIYTRCIQREYISYRELPERLKTHNNQTSFQDRFRVHEMDAMPHTIVAHISKDGHYNIHPDIDQCRSLTVREAARIQSFPDDYKFEGPRTAQFTQVGNAVPPLMAQAIARFVKTILERNPADEQVDA